jgi:hypothetical protein
MYAPPHALGWFRWFRLSSTLKERITRNSGTATERRRILDSNQTNQTGRERQLSGPFTQVAVRHSRVNTATVAKLRPGSSGFLPVDYRRVSPNGRTSVGFGGISSFLLTQRVSQRTEHQSLSFFPRVLCSTHFFQSPLCFPSHHLSIAA